MAEKENIYKKALEILASNIQYESCYYCPYFYAEREKCECAEGKNDCIKKLCDESIRRAKIGEKENEK